MIDSANTPLLVAIVVALSAAAFLIEQRTHIGKKLSGVVIAMFSMMILANLRIVPGTAPAYDFVYAWVVPVAIPMFLFKANLVAIFKETGKTLIAFLLGGLGAAVGSIVMFFLLYRGEETFKLLGLFAATYVGGTINFVAISEILEIQGDTLAAAVAADNVVMALTIMVLFLAPGIRWLADKFNLDEASYREPDSKGPGEARFGGEDVVWTMTLAIVIAGGSMFIGTFIPKIPHILIGTVVTVALATAFPKFFSNIGGSEEIGLFFMYLFFAVIGATADFGMIIEKGGYLFLYAGGTVAIHLAFLLVGGRLLKLPLPELLVASNANLGGPTTACGMAMAKRWDRLIAPAVLVGLFGYAIATFLGWNLVTLMKMIVG